MALGYLLFGQYLFNKGLVTFEDIYSARMMQKRNNRTVGGMALVRGWLTVEDIDRILTIQEERPEKFGEIAVRYGFLSGSRWLSCSMSRRMNISVLAKAW